MTTFPLDSDGVDYRLAVVLPFELATDPLFVGPPTSAFLEAEAAEYLEMVGLRPGGEHVHRRRMSYVREDDRGHLQVVAPAEATHVVYTCVFPTEPVGS